MLCRGKVIILLRIYSHTVVNRSCCMSLLLFRRYVTQLSEDNLRLPTHLRSDVREYDRQEGENIDDQESRGQRQNDEGGIIGWRLSRGEEDDTQEHGDDIIDDDSADLLHHFAHAILARSDRLEEGVYDVKNGPGGEEWHE